MEMIDAFWSEVNRFEGGLCSHVRGGMRCGGIGVRAFWSEVSRFFVRVTLGVYDIRAFWSEMNRFVDGVNGMWMVGGGDGCECGMWDVGCGI